jgi:hypothetical protein
MEYNEAEAYEIARSMDMAIYYVYLLKKGPTWSADSTPEIVALQEAQQRAISSHSYQISMV